MPPQVDVAALAPVEGLRLVRGGLDRATVLLERGSLESVRTLLREPIFSGFLGFTPGVRGNAENLKPAAALVSAGVDKGVLEELLLSLKRLDDFCLENRVVVFNVEDLEQVRTLMASSGKDGNERDLDEARAFLADAGELLDAAGRSLQVE